MRLFFQRLAFEKHGEYVGATKQTTMVETAKLTDDGLKETLNSFCRLEQSRFDSFWWSMRTTHSDPRIRSISED